MSRLWTDTYLKVKHYSTEAKSVIESWSQRYPAKKLMFCDKNIEGVPTDSVSGIRSLGFTFIL